VLLNVEDRTPPKATPELPARFPTWHRNPPATTIHHDP
jgi:hypothetical protein